MQRRVLVEMLDRPDARRSARPRPDGPAGTGSRRHAAGRRGARRPPRAAGRARGSRARPGRSRSGRPAADRPGRRCSSRRRRAPRCPRSRQSGSSSAKRVLVEERVAPGEQEGVDVGLAGEADEHRRLVHADADRADDALARAADRGPDRPRSMAASPVVVGIVDVGDVDTVQAEPLEALLDRARDAVGAVVEDDAPAGDVGVVGVVTTVERLVVDVGARRDRSAGRTRRPTLVDRTNSSRGRSARAPAPSRRSAVP